MVGFTHDAAVYDKVQKRVESRLGAEYVYSPAPTCGDVLAGLRAGLHLDPLALPGAMGARTVGRRRPREDGEQPPCDDDALRERVPGAHLTCACVTVPLCRGDRGAV